MKLFIQFIYLGFVLLFVSCINHSTEEVEVAAEESEEQITVMYAEGFTVTYTADYIKLVTQSISDNEDFKDSLYILKTTNVPKGDVKIVSGAENKLACQSSTYLAFLGALDELNNVRALCGTQYVQDSTVQAVLTANNTAELCLGESIQTEAILGAQTDLFLIYPFGDDRSEEFAKMGIKTLLIAEYLETSQLARLEWIKVFGLITGKVAEANAYFAAAEANYLNLKENARNQDKNFIMNLPFQDSWFMPSPNSVGVELIKDAGLTYFYSQGSGTENQLHTKEEVWNDGVESDYWVIAARRPAEFTLKDLLEEEPVYKEFKSVKNNQVIFCNTATVDYFAQGVIEPDVILKDLLFATGQISDHEPKYFFLLK